MSEEIRRGGATFDVGNRSKSDGSVFLVAGEAGEYSDYRYWPVEAYENETEAMVAAAALNAWRDEQGEGDIDVGPPMDVNFVGGYGVRYSVVEVPKRTMREMASDD